MYIIFKSNDLSVPEDGLKITSSQVKVPVTEIPPYKRRPREGLGLLHSATVLPPKEGLHFLLLAVNHFGVNFITGTPIDVSWVVVGPPM